MNSTSRVCFVCLTPISGCMGFAVIRDVLPILEGKVNTVPFARELCGKDALRYSHLNQEQFEELLAKHPKV